MPGYELGVCPVCKTNEFQQLAGRDEVKSETEELWEFHTRRLKPGSPIDQLFDRAFFSQDPPVHIVQCDNCGTVLRNPREGAADIVDVYSSEVVSKDTFEELFGQQRAFFRRRLRRLQRLLGRRGSVFEVGSYVGGFLANATLAGWTADGLDVNDEANEFARAHGCSVTTGSIDDYQPDRAYDVVTFWNCFDQLPDPSAALHWSRQILAKGGLLVVRIPNGSFYATMRELPSARALLAYNNLLGFPYRHGFTPASLRTLLGDAGFNIVRLRGDVLVPTAGRWTRRWAVAEERAIKAMLAVLPARFSPWLECYAEVV